MAQQLYYHSKEGNTGPKARPNPAWQTPNPVAPCHMSKVEMSPPRVADFSTLLFVGLFYLLCATVLGWFPTVLVPPTFWGLQYNPGLTLTAPYNRDYYGSLFRDSPATCLFSVAFLNLGRRFQNPFASVSFMNKARITWLMLRMEPDLLEYHLLKL